MAQITGYWPESRELFKKKLSDLENDGFGFKLDFLVYALLGCVHRMGSDMRRLHQPENKDELQAAWNLLDNQVLDYVVNIIRSRAYVDHLQEVNSPYALIPIVVYCFDRKGSHLTDIEIRKMIKWFYYSQIRARYVSQLPQKLDRDLRILTESTQPFDDLLQVIAEDRPLEVLPIEFVGRVTQHPLFSMVRWYLKSLGALCLTTGVKLHKNMGKKYQIELDHIFPYSRLKEKGYGRENRVKYALAQEFTNRALLTMVANRDKATTNADKYLADVARRYPKSLARQCIPEDQQLWHIDRYEDFLEARRNLLASKINRTLTILRQRRYPLYWDRTGRLNHLGWDTKEGKTNKNLEIVVLKTIAALANANGGTLLIGVDDEGNADYARDAFGYTCATSAGAFVARSGVNDADICRFCHNTVFLKIKDKNGHSKFFPRNLAYVSEQLRNSPIRTCLSENKSGYHIITQSRSINV